MKLHTCHIVAFVEFRDGVFKRLFLDAGVSWYAWYHTRCRRFFTSEGRILYMAWHKRADVEQGVLSLSGNTQQGVIK